MSEKAKIRYHSQKKHFARSSAELFKAHASVRLNERTRRVPLVKKVFSKDIDARDAFNVYERLRNLMGVTLLPATYRPSRSRKNVIYMTDLDRGGNVTVASNYIRPIGGSIESLDLEHFRATLKKIEGAILSLGSHGAYAPDFSYFAILPKGGGTEVKVDAVLGDLEHITFRDPRDKAANINANLISALWFLERTVLSRMPNPECKTRAKEMMQAWAQDIRKKNGIPE